MHMTTLTDGPLSFRFHDAWATIPDTPSGRINGRTHGVAALADGRVVVVHQASPGILVYDAEGRLMSSARENLVGAHGLTPIPSNPQATDAADLRFWVVDQESCSVEETSLDGTVHRRLDAPAPTFRPDGRYVPTWADTAPDGRVIVADGYGGSALHRYDPDGVHLDTFRQAGKATPAGADGRFDCPHAIRFDGEGTLWVADRGNRRVLRLDENFDVIAESSEACHSPCGFAFHDGLAYVPELFGGLKVLNADLAVVASLGQHPDFHPDAVDAMIKKGWPNTPAEALRPDAFNSPHGVDVDADGNVYVVEWIVGGRIIKLERC